jgi:glutamate racemase
VAERAQQVAGQLIEAGAKLVTVACHSASAAALDELRAAYPQVSIVGMEPAVKPAALRSVSGVIGVLATATTFQGRLYASVVDRHAAATTVLPVVGEGLAELVESGKGDQPAAKELLSRYLDPLLDAGMDTLVLGCTHYPFLVDTIRDIVGDGVEIIDPAPAVARQVGRVLSAGSMRAPYGAPPDVTLATTGDVDRFALQVERLMGRRDGWTVRRW